MDGKKSKKTSLGRVLQSSENSATWRIETEVIFEKDFWRWMCAEEKVPEEYVIDLFPDKGSQS